MYATAQKISRIPKTNVDAVTYKREKNFQESILAINLKAESISLEAASLNDLNS